MSLIRDLLDLRQSKQIVAEPIKEARVEQFDDVITIKIDPDRDDTTDLARKMIPAILSVAYVYLIEDKDKHEKMNSDYDPDDEDSEKPEDFLFTEEELFDRCDDVMRHMSKAFQRIDHEDLKLNMHEVEKHFKQALGKKK